jgi:hypothetical protein
VISWEVFFGGRARDGVKSGGELIVNPTNGASYTGTILQTQQVASSRLRAVETGRWLVQAAPTGFSEFVTPGGDVLQRTAVSEQRVITGEVELRTGTHVVRAPRRRPFIVAAAAALAVAMALARRRPGPRPTRARRRPGRQTSRSTVTGPSLTSSTRISERKRPLATVAPRCRSAATTASTSGSACSGRAAATQLGRRPLVVSPYNVNWLTTRTAASHRSPPRRRATGS